MTPPDARRTGDRADERATPGEEPAYSGLAANEMSIPSNLFRDLPTNVPEEVVQTLVSAEAVRVERIVSHGHASPDGFWYDQARPEFVVLLRGAARLRFEDGEVEMRPGSFLDIPAHRRHRVEWTTPDEPTVWLAVHYGD